MRHWVGRPVIMYCGDKPYTIMKGILRKWDPSLRVAVIGHQEITVPFQDIVYIKALAHKERALIALNTTIVSHTKGSVTLEDGQNLIKGNHTFVVRSLRG
jgi:hypothetical protein